MCRTLDAYHSPVFVGGASTEDKKAMTHASCAAMTNKITLIDLVMCERVDVDSAYPLPKGLKCDHTISFLADEGRAMLGAIENLGMVAHQPPKH